ncbi:Uncharacterized protein ACMD2_03948 [Ananas comosus]|uniref:Glutaredoxin domain-containing protein n=1 Tax=Ananas comosus TaxID=4615 RepID=A0A199V610_ANACO|nr:Uncharacterized protein ACMD2_03948 [Ananas comosus]
MGCTSSKQARIDLRQGARSPCARSFSVPIERRSRDDAHNHHGAAAAAAPERCAAAALLDEAMMKSANDAGARRPGAPRTPTKTPPNEPEIINAWELMAGLEDSSTPRLSVERSFSFHTSRDLAPKPGWMLLEPGESVVSDFDPDILSTFRSALEEEEDFSPPLLRPPRPRSPEILTTSFFERGKDPKFSGLVRARINAFQQRIDAKRAAKVAPSSCRRRCPPGGERKVVLYLTSLRGVRKTHEDCWGVRAILQGYGVRVDERDVSMHAGFKEELNCVLGKSFAGKLPRVFADGRYLGEAEEVRQMHEAGELGKALENCQMAPAPAGKGAEACRGCGGVRFVPCETCSGSCKVYVEGEEEEEEEDEKGGGGFRRCPDCNENGLVRCPLCC